MRTDDSTQVMIARKVQVKIIHPKNASQTNPFALYEIAKPPISIANASCANTRDDLFNFEVESHSLSTLIRSQHSKSRAGKTFRRHIDMLSTSRCRSREEERLGKRPFS
jgi:hypothetical protein